MRHGRRRSSASTYPASRSGHPGSTPAGCILELRQDSAPAPTQPVEAGILATRQHLPSLHPGNAPAPTQHASRQRARTRSLRLPSLRPSGTPAAPAPTQHAPWHCATAGAAAAPAPTHQPASRNRARTQRRGAPQPVAAGILPAARQRQRQAPQPVAAGTLAALPAAYQRQRQDSAPAATQPVEAGAQVASRQRLPQACVSEQRKSDGETHSSPRLPVLVVGRFLIHFSALRAGSCAKTRAESSSLSLQSTKCTMRYMIIATIAYLTATAGAIRTV